MVDEVAEFANQHLVCIYMKHNIYYSPCFPNWAVNSERRLAHSVLQTDSIRSKGFHLWWRSMGKPSLAKRHGEIYQSPFSSSNESRRRSPHFRKRCYWLVRNAGFRPLQQRWWHSLFPTHLSSIQGWLWNDSEVGDSSEGIRVCVRERDLINTIACNQYSSTLTTSINFLPRQSRNTKRRWTKHRKKAYASERLCSVIRTILSDNAIRARR